MTTIDIKGAVVDDETAFLYDFFGMQCVSPKGVSDAMNDGSDDDIVLNIASNGGDVFAASEIYTMLRSSDRNVTVNIQGLAASAASVIAMAGDTVNISPTAQLMIHQAMTSGGGNKDDLAQQIDVLDGIDHSIAAAYEAKTGINQGELLNMMANETWIGAQEAIDKGFADSIMFVNEDDLQFANAVDNQVPKSAVNKLMNLISKANKADEAKNVAEDTSDKTLKSESDNITDESRTYSLRSEKAAILLGKTKEKA